MASEDTYCSALVSMCVCVVYGVYTYCEYIGQCYIQSLSRLCIHTYVVILANSYSYILYTHTVVIYIILVYVYRPRPYHIRGGSGTTHSR